MKNSFEIKGMEDLIKNIEKMGKDVDGAIHEAVDKGADMLLEAERENVKRHYRTGAALRAVKRTEVKKVGDMQSADVGALYIRGQDKDGFHVVYLERGSPRLAADPWEAPAIEKTRPKIRKAQIDILKKAGVPVE